jgi:hypothetical protein
MPGLNDVGSLGKGLKIGRGIIFCGKGVVGQVTLARRCFNRGMRMGMRFNGKEDKIKILENEEKTLQKEIESIREEKGALRA